MTKADSLPRVDLPSPDAPLSDIEARLQRVRAVMQGAGVAALVCSSKQNVEYFTGYRTGSWTSNSRPVFALIDSERLVLIGSMTEERNVNRAERPFSAKYYRGFVEDAISELSMCLGDSIGPGHPKVGLDYGHDMFGRGSIPLVETLAKQGSRPVDAADLIWRVRMIKSQYEADMKRTAFTIVNRAFDSVLADVRIGCSEVEVYRRLQAQMALNGADALDQFTVLFGNVELAYCRPPTDRRLQDGQYLWTDFRAAYAGYPGDRNRIARAGRPSSWERQTYRDVRDLTVSLANSLKPGMTGGDAYAVFENLWRDADVGPLYNRVSRVGHGGGMDLTEPPSLMKESEEVLQDGMIIHVEPKLEARDAVFQFEEIIWLRDGGNEFLSEPHPEEMPVVLR